ncbi:MAG: sensor histidine kinase [Bdellovibrio sp.]
MVLRRRFVLTLTLFVLSLILLIGSSTWFINSFFPKSLEDSFEKVYKTQAQSVGEQIGAQFFERYGDIQAMAEATSLLIDAKDSKKKIEDLLNSYARLYRLYDFIMVVDKDGKVLGSNTRDVENKKFAPPTFTQEEIKKSLWFSNPMSGVFTADADKGLTGSYFSLTRVHSKNNGFETQSLFSALVYKQNKVVGVIVSFSRLNWLTQVVQEQYNKFIKLGMSETELQVLDENGKVLAGYSKSTQKGKNTPAGQDIVIEEKIESTGLPKSLAWRVQIESPRSDFRQLVQYSKFYYALLATFFFAALSIVTVYTGRQLRSLSKENEAAIAEQSRLEHLINEQTKALEKNVHELRTMQERVVAQEKMASLGIMATGLAHEIKNPLNVVLNSSQYLIDYYMENRIKGDIDEARRFAEMIVKHSERIDALVKAILLSARKDTSVEAEIVDVNELVKELVQVSIKTFQIQYHVAIPVEIISSSGNANVKLITEDLRRTILNLIDNALYSLFKKWGAEGISKALLKVAVLTKESSVILIVEDNGLGISETEAKNIFAPFFTTKEPGKGTGLGLSMSADLMQKYGGRIYFESQKNSFCRFFVELPKFEKKS